jgi:hypothetical protein
MTCAKNRVQALLFSEDSLSQQIQLKFSINHSLLTLLTLLLTLLTVRALRQSFVFKKIIVLNWGYWA